MSLKRDMMDVATYLEDRGAFYHTEVVREAVKVIEELEMKLDHIKFQTNVIAGLATPRGVK